MTLDDFWAWITRESPVCICGQVIPDSAIYYAFPLSEDADTQYANVNEWHEHCLGEWGFERDNSAFGIAHTHYASAGRYGERMETAA